MNNLRHTLILVLFAGLVSCTGYRPGVIVRDTDSPSMTDSVSLALEYQLANYPASQYRDVYKNFMQDFFGPGHIIADTAASGSYLRLELGEDGPFEGPLYEKTGYKGNFYRVNLSLVKEGIVPYETFFTTFVRSAQAVTPPDGKDWMATWSVIDSVIKAKGLHFPDEFADREALAEQFGRGDYVVHHSRRFNDSVRFHYRIISKDNFEQIILPLLKQCH
ncbi:MAG: hypothetical protein K2O24_04480 [Muribaculaceae bacterium]|nr:hypothetical protein [Muribaculaceae bacterium]